MFKIVKGNDEEDLEVLIFRESSVGVRWQSSVQAVIPSELESRKQSQVDGSRDVALRQKT